MSDRDFLLEFLSTNSITAVHLSRLAEEWVLWASEEFGFLIPNDAVSTGSSIMPQKKNPDPMELVRGKSARVIGNLTTLLVLCKGLPQAYNRDLQVMAFLSFLFVPLIEQQLDYHSRKLISALINFSETATSPPFSKKESRLCEKVEASAPEKIRMHVIFVQPQGAARGLESTTWVFPTWSLTK